MGPIPDQPILLTKALEGHEGHVTPVSSLHHEKGKAWDPFQTNPSC